MGLMGGGKFTPLGGSKDITLNDKDGVDYVAIRDNTGFPAIKLMSNGDIQMKGQVRRTLTN